MERKNVKYGIVGFSRNQFDKKSAHQILEDLFVKIKEKHSNKEIEIVSGYTNSGVPKNITLRAISLFYFSLYKSLF